MNLPKPKYVKLGHSTLRLRGNEYYRDAGEWGVKYRVVDGNLISWTHRNGLQWLHKQPLIEITEQEYKDDNKGYC